MTSDRASGGDTVSLFDRHTRVVVGDDGRLRGEIAEGWAAGRGAVGGYVAALALNALATTADGRPRSLAVHLLRPADAGPLAIDASAAGRGGTTSNASAQLRQGEVAVATATGVFSTAGRALETVEVAPPRVPPPWECEPLGGVLPDTFEMMGMLEYRPAREPLPLAGAAVGELVVWMRLRERRPVDAPLAVFLADAAAPALFARMDDAIAIPSVELAVHLTASLSQDGGSSEWVLGVFRHRRTDAGFCTEDGELWDVDGRLLALSRQLRRVPSKVTIAGGAAQRAA